MVRLELDKDGLGEISETNTSFLSNNSFAGTFGWVGLEWVRLG
jgi:hypothetical protein